MAQKADCTLRSGLFGQPGGGDCGCWWCFLLAECVAGCVAVVAGEVTVDAGGWVCSCGGPLSCGAVCRCVLGTEAVIFLLRRHSGSCYGPCPSPFCRLKHSVQAMLSSFLAFAEFGTGEGLLRYGICVPCSKRLPPVRDAFSEAFGVKNRLLRYGMNIRYRNPPFLVRDRPGVPKTAS